MRAASRESSRELAAADVHAGDVPDDFAGPCGPALAWRVLACVPRALKAVALALLPCVLYAWPARELLRAHAVTLHSVFALYAFAFFVIAASMFPFYSTRGASALSFPPTTYAILVIYWGTTILSVVGVLLILDHVFSGVSFERDRWLVIFVLFPAVSGFAQFLATCAVQWAHSVSVMNLLMRDVGYGLTSVLQYFFCFLILSLPQVVEWLPPPYEKIMGIVAPVACAEAFQLHIREVFTRSLHDDGEARGSEYTGPAGQEDDVSDSSDEGSRQRRSEPWEDSFFYAFMPLGIIEAAAKVTAYLSGAFCDVLIVLVGQMLLELALHAVLYYRVVLQVRSWEAALATSESAQGLVWGSRMCQCEDSRGTEASSSGGASVYDSGSENVAGGIVPQQATIIDSRDGSSVDSVDVVQEAVTTSTKPQWLLIKEKTAAKAFFAEVLRDAEYGAHLVAVGACWCVGRLPGTLAVQLVAVGLSSELLTDMLAAWMMHCMGMPNMATVIRCRWYLMMLCAFWPAAAMAILIITLC